MPAPFSIAPFRWQDGDRLIVFGRGTLEQAAELLGEGFTLLTTPRAAAVAPAVAALAGPVHHVAAGLVDELAGELAPLVDDPGEQPLVALGGGRVIDVAKAVAAARGRWRVAALPTTLSAAEMTPFHRPAVGAPADSGFVRPSLVLNDPALCASQPEDELAASAANALAHASEAVATTLANPLTSAVALEAAVCIGHVFSDAEEPDRDAAALGALMSGWANGYAAFGLHHVLCQTLARFTPAGHSPSNTIMLPHTLTALAARAPGPLGRLDAALGEPAVALAGRLARRSGAVRLRDRGVTEEMLERCADEAAARPQLALTPPPASRDEIIDLYRQAW